ncbi:MAG: GNAT family N-acetyltransferase [Eggerthellaceae bacterium]|nr:GNAT family N-acetyltransferase [Eggerthellaceae bacterium]
MIETQRLRIYVASQCTMEHIIDAETDADLKAAYQEMLDGCLAHPADWEWYAIWLIELKDGTRVGDLCFKGPNDGVPEIGYGILDEHQGQGYATEAVKAVLTWAFAQHGVTAIEAETDPGNASSQRVLAKCGFVPNGVMGEEGPRFVLTRQGFRG